MFQRNRTLNDLIEQQRELDEGKVDVRCKTSDLSVFSLGKGETDAHTLALVVPHEGEEHAKLPTDHALRQLASLHTFESKHWRRMEMEECPRVVRESYAEHISDILTTRFGLKSTDPEKLVRLHHGRVRAVMSSDYAVFQCMTALELAQKAFDVLDNAGTEVKVYDAHQTADELCVRLIAPQHGREEGDGGSPVFPGVYIGNSEIGTKRLYVQPLVLRQICSNGMMGVREEGVGMQRVHRGSMLILENDFNLALANALNLADQQVEQFMNLTEVTVQEPLKELARLWAKNKTRAEFTNEKFTTAEDFLKRYTQQFGDTKYSVVNTLTELAQTFDEVNAQTFDEVNARLTVEQIAGEYAFAGVTATEL
jgi:hypothetical protein